VSLDADFQGFLCSRALGLKTGEAVESMIDRSVYLDHNASAPLLPEAAEAIAAALKLTGNPSSVHGHGRALRELIEAGRDRVAKAAGAEGQQVIFTGSATEAITQAIVGARAALGIDRIIMGATEHAAVSAAAQLAGVPVEVLGVDGNGIVELDRLREMVGAAEGRLLVCLQWVNNETGVVQPIEAIEAIVGPTPHFLFVDAVQAFGKRPLDFASRATDMMAVSAHKIGGPVGVGALLAKAHADGVRLIPGGGQEQNRRGGTQSAALIAGFGAAAEAFPARYKAAGVEHLLAELEAGLLSLAPDLETFGQRATRLGNVSNFAVPGLKAGATMMALDLEGLSVSSGSACSSGRVGPSHVLAAMGVDPALAEGALRISLGWSSMDADIAAFLNGFSDVLARHRRRRAQAA
jgi:cysteine desulfurase